MPNGLLNNLVGYWKLDEGTGTTAADASGNGVTLTYTAGTPSWVTGKIGGACDFNAGGYFLSAAGAINCPSAWTVSLWVSLDSLPAPTTTFNYCNNYYGGIPQFEMLLLVNGSGWVAGAANEYGQASGAIPAPTAGAWHNHVATFDGTTATVYWDGVSVGTLTILNSAAETYTFGLGNFPGATDEVGVWNVAKPPTAVAALYNGGAGLPYSSFDNGTGGGGHGRPRVLHMGWTPLLAAGGFMLAKNPKLSRRKLLLPHKGTDA